MARDDRNRVPLAVWLTFSEPFRFAELGSVRLSHDLAWQAWDAARIVMGYTHSSGSRRQSF